MPTWHSPRGSPRWVFSIITEQLIRRGMHASVQALETEVGAWVNNWNDNPTPFIWTKAADEILYRQQISRTDLRRKTLEGTPLLKKQCMGTHQHAGLVRLLGLDRIVEPSLEQPSRKLLLFIRALDCPIY